MTPLPKRTFGMDVKDLKNKLRYGTKTFLKPNYFSIYSQI